MKTETLKIMIDAEFKRHKNLTISEDRILKELNQYIKDAIDLYERDNKTDISVPSIPYDLWSFANNDKVPYYTLCGCNPAKGGSGVCSCIMANTMVDKI